MKLVVRPRKRPTEAGSGALENLRPEHIAGQENLIGFRKLVSVQALYSMGVAQKTGFSHQDGFQMESLHKPVSGYLPLRDRTPTSSQGLWGGGPFLRACG